MNNVRQNALTLVTICLAVPSLAVWGWGQALPSAESAAANDKAAARREILESDRWRQARRGFNNWLAEQQIYTADEAAAIRAKIDADVSTMSASEMMDFLEDTEERLEVLTSPEALEARRWVSQFLVTARNAEQQIRQKRPDVINMTAGQIRLELERFHRERGARHQSQAAFDRGRAQQLQTARSSQASAQEAQQQLRDNRSRAAANVQAQRQQPVSPDDRPGHTDFNAVRPDVSPVYAISPWGTPIRWNATHVTNF
jgi:hypothetical protein